MAGMAGMEGWTLPGAQTISEWQSPINGFIATCVEASTAVITGIYGVLAPTAQTTQRLAQDLIHRGQASSRGGATNYLAAGAQLDRLGIPTRSYGADWIASHNPFTVINQALASGRPVLIGTTNAQALRDSTTGAMPDLGVHNHGLTIVGADARSYLVADPNTAPGSGFMHYTPQNLEAASLSSLTIPTLSAPAVTSASSATAAPFLGGSGTAASSSSGSGSSGGGSGLPSWIQSLAETLAQSTGAVGSIQGEQGFIKNVNQLQNPGELVNRAGLMLLAITLVGIGVLAFFFAGSGRNITIETAKAGTKAAVGAAVA